MTNCISNSAKGGLNPHFRVVETIGFLAVSIILIALGAVLAAYFNQVYIGISYAAIAIGSVAVLTRLVCLAIANYKKKEALSASPEQLQQVKWHCPQTTSRTQLAAVYQAENDLCTGKWRDYTMQPQEKLVVVVPVVGHQAGSVIGEDNSPENLVVQKYQEVLGERLLVLFDVERAANKKKWEDCKNPRGNISQEPIWDTIFSTNRWLCTTDPDWRQKLSAFLSKPTG